MEYRLQPCADQSLFVLFLFFVLVFFVIVIVDIVALVQYLGMRKSGNSEKALGTTYPCLAESLTADEGSNSLYRHVSSNGY